MRFSTAKSQLVIEFHGREQIWALKTKVSVLKKHIVRVEYKPIFRDWRKWEVRLPGTGMPGKLIAGSFWTEEGWDFLYLKNPKGWLNPIVYNVLYIETTDKKYHRIILSCPADEAGMVTEWANQ